MNGMQLQQAYHRIVAYRRAGIAVYTFSITCPVAICVVLGARGIRQGPSLAFTVQLLQLVLLAALSFALAWSGSLSLQSRALASLPTLLQPVLTRLAGPTCAIQTGRVLAAVKSCNRQHAVHATAAGLLGTLYVLATLHSLTSADKHGRQARQAVDGPNAAALACRSSLHHCATGVWLYGLSVGLAHVLLTTARCHLLQSAASATSCTAWSLLQCCMPRAGRALHFPVVQRQRIYRLKLVVLPGLQRPQP